MWKISGHSALFFEVCPKILTEASCFSSVPSFEIDNLTLDEDNRFIWYWLAGPRDRHRQNYFEVSFLKKLFFNFSTDWLADEGRTDSQSPIEWATATDLKFYFSNIHIHGKLLLMYICQTSLDSYCGMYTTRVGRQWGKWGKAGSNESFLV